MIKKKVNIRELCQISIFTAIIVICAQVSIPMPYGVPMTLQTFAIPLAGVVLGKKNGTIATLIYILLGASGVPVFAGFTSGMGIIFSMTGGFIISFPFMAWSAGVGAARENNLILIMWLLAGTTINSLCGMLIYSLVTSNSLTASFGYVVTPFIPAALVKIVLVIAVGKSLRQALKKSGVLL